MKKSLPKFYWDANLFLAWITNEKRKKGEMEGLAEVAAMVTGREAFIITSVMTRVEVLESTLSTSQVNMFDNLFKRRNVKMENTTGPIAVLAQKIRDFYLQRRKKLDVADSTHLATAIIYEVDAFHTFDEGDLIPLSGNVAGHNLTICMPKGKQMLLFS